MNARDLRAAVLVNGEDAIRLRAHAEWLREVEAGKVEPLSLVPAAMGVELVAAHLEEQVALALRPSPPWIDASERQPADIRERPCVCEDAHGQFYQAARLWGDGQWWWREGFEMGVDGGVRYWMEVYPLPDGTRPAEVGRGVGAQTGEGEEEGVRR